LQAIFETYGIFLTTGWVDIAFKGTYWLKVWCFVINIESSPDID
jgi:hypothetical protein